ncbi:winged helix-turn-helix domain-containing protein [Paenarthrobacter sp. DKR-5]|uniref:ArsR/SmtB family transcription factor n=1 Tax=Paenarthrobacter sp. DKR-5 TaxID=2835535 RepID=UPI001BDC6018|nr:winged helix-turn-helix domain-containing protein [Paenarthrobacter sp. DKR-5]MBT1002891.1 winged helix-turn-helix domain-containing protein [Paenarthrobacter sp. DKR-5]
MSGAPNLAEDEVIARSRALSSPLRLRIMRLCLHQARTNKEIADALGMNPASTLHHVRTLLRAGFLAAEEPRRGNRGAREVPYRSTKISWNTPVKDVAPVLVETFLQEIAEVPASELSVWRLGFKFTPERRDEMIAKVRAVFDEYARLPPDPEGFPISVMFAYHRDPAGTPVKES